MRPCLGEGIAERGMNGPGFGQYASHPLRLPRLGWQPMNTLTKTVPSTSSHRIDPAKVDALLNRVITDLAAGYAGVMISLGRQLGFYKVLAGAGPVSSHELAARTGCAERYVREWLNSQVAGGYLGYHPSSQTYELLPEQALILADESSPAYIAPAWEVPASMWADQPRAIEAFRTGKGIPWGEHDGRLHCGCAAFYRNAYRKQLVPEWLPSLNGVAEQLSAGGKVADVGCGHGHSTILMAEAFPNSRFEGFDPHKESIEAARANSVAAGVDHLIEFSVGSAKTFAGHDFDLICFFDCLHDLGDPIGALRHARKALSKRGAVMVVEPMAKDRVEENINPVSQIYYSASSTICCAHSLSEEVGLALGAQAGESRLERVFQAAGLAHVRKAMETPFNIIFEARP